MSCHLYESSSRSIQGAAPSTASSTERILAHALFEVRLQTGQRGSVEMVSSTSGLPTVLRMPPPRVDPLEKSSIYQWMDEVGLLPNGVLML